MAQRELLHVKEMSASSNKRVIWWFNKERTSNERQIRKVSATEILKTPDWCQNPKHNGYWFHISFCCSIWTKYQLPIEKCLIYAMGIGSADMGVGGGGGGSLGSNMLVWDQSHLTALSGNRIEHNLCLLCPWITIWNSIFFSRSKSQAISRSIEV